MSPVPRRRRRAARVRRAFVLVALGLSCSLLWPVRAGAGAPLTGDARAEAIARLQGRQRELTTLRADVTQRKRHPLLKGEVVTHGTLLFRRPNRVRWEVATPERTVLVIADETLVIYHPDRQEAERRDLRGDFGARAIVEFLRAGMNMDVAELETRFQVDLYRDDRRLTLVLTPRSAWVARAIASVTMTQDDEDAVPRRIVLVGQQGDRTETSLTHLVVNPPLAADAFTLTLGPEVRVIDALRAPQDAGSGR